MAISGIDLALWDLHGKMLHEPVARLLNQDVELDAPLPTYRTVFDDHETEAALRAGHSAVKLHVERFGDEPELKAICELVERVRESLGPDAPLMIDAFARWNVETTLAIADAIAMFGVDWLEEPLPPNELDGYATLAKQSPVPIAGGEHEYLIDGFRRLIDGRLHAVLQPDVNWCGGMTTLIDVYREAQAAGLRVCPHRGAEPYALHAVAALDRAPLAESPRTWFKCLDGAAEIERGFITVPNRPGFGITSSVE